MGKKKKHDYLVGSRWSKTQIADPYEAIAECFTSCHLTDFRKFITGVFLFIYRDKIYNKTTPSTLLVDFQILELLINAAYLINKKRKKSPIMIMDNEAFNKNLYCKNSGSCEWDLFPRFLSLKEYKNPYKVFKDFFKYRELDEWKQDLEEILSSTLSKYADYAELNVHVLPMYIHLMKLIEAAHLIDVRETTHVHGHIKNRL